MLETLREYGLECLRGSAEVLTVQRAHACYYLRLAEEAEPRLKGAEQLAWLANSRGSRRTCELPSAGC